MFSKYLPFFIGLILVAVVCTTVVCQYQSRQDDVLFSTQADATGVDAVAFSRDGKCFFSGGSEGLKQWDTTSFRLMHDPKIEIGKPGQGNTYSIGSIASSPSRSELYLAGGINDVVVWNYETQQVIARIPNSGAWVSALAINKKGTLLAIAENDINVDTHGKGVFKVRLWDLDKSETKHILVGHDQAISSLDFSHSGDLLVSRAHIGAIVWSVVAGTIQGRIGHFGDSELNNPLTRENRNAVFSPDDRHVLYFGKLISTDSWTEVSRFPQGARASAFTPDGRRVLLGGVAKAALVDVESGETISEFVQFPKKQEPINCLAISPDGTMAVTGGWGTHVSLTNFGKPTDVKRNLCVWRLPQDDAKK